MFSFHPILLPFNNIFSPLSSHNLGFIGKGVTRHMNRAWNYVMKGIVGTLFLTTLFPLTCLLVSLGSMGIAVAAPLW